MYAWPLTLPIVSNREDFLLSVSIFDDDLGSPVNLSGTNGAAFTGNNWTVTDGAIVTTSSTAITIPAFPIGNQLSALALTVGTNLGIVQGDPITITDAGGSGNSITGYVVSYAAQTGALVVQIGVTFQFEIRKKGPHNQGYGMGGYVPFYDFGTGPGGPELSAALGTGITITDVGYLQILIPEATFKKLHGGTHVAALTMTDSVNTRQVFIADLPVLRGRVTN